MDAEERARQLAAAAIAARQESNAATRRLALGVKAFLRRRAAKAIVRRQGERGAAEAASLGGTDVEGARAYVEAAKEEMMASRARAVQAAKAAAAAAAAAAKKTSRPLEGLPQEEAAAALGAALGIGAERAAEAMRQLPGLAKCWLPREGAPREALVAALLGSGTGLGLAWAHKVLMVTPEIGKVSPEAVLCKVRGGRFAGPLLQAVARRATGPTCLLAFWRMWRQHPTPAGRARQLRGLSCQSPAHLAPPQIRIAAGYPGGWQPLAHADGPTAAGRVLTADLARLARLEYLSEAHPRLAALPRRKSKNKWELPAVGTAVRATHTAFAEEYVEFLHWLRNNAERLERENPGLDFSDCVFLRPRVVADGGGEGGGGLRVEGYDLVTNYRKRKAREARAAVIKELAQSGQSAKRPQ